MKLWTEKLFYFMFDHFSYFLSDDCAHHMKLKVMDI